MDSLDTATEDDTYVEEDTSIIDEVYEDLPDDDSGDIFASVYIAINE